MSKWLFLVLLLPLAAQAAVYRWVDESGNVVFSDQPHPGAKKIQLPGISTYQPPAAVSNGNATPTAKPAAGAGTYSVQIESPTDQQTIHDNNGNLNVRVSIQPALQPGLGAQIAASLDDHSQTYKSSGTSLTIPNIDRGTHVLHVWVEGRNGQPISERSSVTFYMRRASVKHPKPPQTPANGANPYQPAPLGNTYQPPSSENAYKPPSSENAYKPPSSENAYKPPANGGTYTPRTNPNTYKPPASFHP